MDPNYQYNKKDIIKVIDTALQKYNQFLKSHNKPEIIIITKIEDEFEDEFSFQLALFINHNKASTMTCTVYTAVPLDKNTWNNVVSDPKKGFLKDNKVIFNIGMIDMSFTFPAYKEKQYSLLLRIICYDIFYNYFGCLIILSLSVSEWTLVSNVNNFGFQLDQNNESIIKQLNELEETHKILLDKNDFNPKLILTITNISDYLFCNIIGDMTDSLRVEYLNNMIKQVEIGQCPKDCKSPLPIGRKIFKK